MSDTMQSLDQFSSLKPAAPEAPKYVKKVDKHGRAYATGKRKDAVARVWIKPGAGKIMVNTREVEVYFARPVLRMMIQQPLVACDPRRQYDVICTVAGGGLSGQAGAVRHGISKALTYFEPDLRSVLKKGGFLTRDSPYRRAQEVRPCQGPQVVPVLEALKIVRKCCISSTAERAPCGALFVRIYRRVDAVFPKICACLQTDFQQSALSVCAAEACAVRFGRAG